MKISEFAKAVNVNVETVRYYHRSGVLDTPVSGDSYRQYNQSHLKQIKFIQNAKLAGFSLSDIRELKNLDAVRDRVKIRKLSEQKKLELEKKLNELKAAKIFIDFLITECKESNSQTCPILDGLSGSGEYG